MFTREAAYSFQIHWVLLYSVAVVVFICVYKYAYARNYSFFVEASCDPELMECYSRDCEIDYCPPRGLEVYTVFRMPAVVFDSCTNNECVNICADGHTCTEITCSEQEDISCVGPGN